MNDKTSRLLRAAPVCAALAVLAGCGGGGGSKPGAKVDPLPDGTPTVVKSVGDRIEDTATLTAGNTVPITYHAFTDTLTAQVDGRDILLTGDDRRSRDGATPVMAYSDADSLGRAPEFMHYTIESATGEVSASMFHRANPSNSQYPVFLADGALQIMLDRTTASALPQAGTVTYTGSYVAAVGDLRAEDLTSGASARTAIHGNASVTFAYANGRVSGAITDRRPLDHVSGTYLSSGGEPLVLRDLELLPGTLCDCGVFYGYTRRAGDANPSNIGGYGGMLGGRGMDQAVGAVEMDIDEAGIRGRETGIFVVE